MAPPRVESLTEERHEEIQQAALDLDHAIDTYDDGEIDATLLEEAVGSVVRSLTPRPVEQTPERPHRTELVLDDMGQARLAMTLRKAKYVINHPHSQQKPEALSELDAFLDILWGDNQ